MQNCARPWSIRRQRPRCSASSAARPRTCSRYSTPSSRARPGFVGLMTWCCGSARGTLWFRGLILVPYPCPRAASRSVLMRHSIAGCASMARSTFPISSEQNDFPIVRARGWRTFLTVPLRQHGELIGTLNARRIEVRPFTPAQIKLLETFADQAVIAIENVRLFKNSRNRWSSKLRRAKSWASSPARRRTSSQCWMWSQKTRRGYVMRPTRSSRIDGDKLRPVANYGPMP